MLKKILPILFIFCFVFSFTVPCFAQDIGRPVYYNQLDNQFLNFHKFSNNSQTSILYDQDHFDVTIVGTGYLNGISIDNLPRTVIGHYYLVLGYFDRNNFSIGFDYSRNNSKAATPYSDHIFYTIEVCNYVRAGLLVRNDATFQASLTFELYDLYIVDLSLIYDDPSSVTINQFFNDFPIFLTPGVSYTQKSDFYNPSVSDGFDKMLSFMHVFDRIPYFFDQYTTVTVWIVGSVSLTIVILVIVFFA